jgi:outer membrane protein, multidrug efflux system
MIRRIILHLVFPFILHFLSGCRAYRTDAPLPEFNLPESYSAGADSSSLADIGWRQFLDDTVLVQLIDSALVNNPDLLIAWQRIETAGAEIKSAKGALFPQVSSGAGLGLRKFGLYTMDGAGNITTDITPGQIVPIHLPDYYLGFQSAWEIDVAGRLRNLKKSAVAGYLGSIEGTHFVTSRLVADIAATYYELIALDNELHIVQETIQKQEEALQVVRLQKEAGRTNEVAVQQFLAQLLNTRSIEYEIRQQIVETESLLNYLLGRFQQPVPRNRQSLFAQIPKQLDTGVPAHLMSNRPDVREAEFQVVASKFDLKAARSEFFPQLNLFAGIGYQAFNPGYLFISPESIAYSLLGSLAAPLVNMSAIKAQFNKAKAAQLTAVYNYQKTILTAYTEVVNELSNIQNLNQVKLLKQEQSSVLKQSVESSTELYKTAKASYLEVLLAQQNSLLTDLELINAVKLQRISMVNLYRALGGGWR